MAIKTIEERVTLLERKLADNAQGIEGLRHAVADLGTRVDRGFAAVERRFEAVDRRFEGMKHRFEAMEQRFDRRFLWVLGTQVAILIAILGAFSGLVTALLRG